MAKGLPTRRRRPRRASDVMGPPTDRALLLQLVLEVNQILQDTLGEFGVTLKEQRNAAFRARKAKKRARPSAAFVTRITSCGDVLSSWPLDRRYVGSDGNPRVLRIRGRGATLETLAHKYAPQMTLEQVLDFICKQGEAAIFKGDRVALLGSPAVIARQTPELLLAWAVTTFRHLASTTIHNAAIPAHIKNTGLFQRPVAGWLSDPDFRRYAQEVRPQLQELFNQLEAGLSLERRTKPRANRKECGVSLFVYQDSGNIG
jgi:hypothetical protein